MNNTITETKKAYTMTFRPASIELASKAAKLSNVSTSAYIEKLILEHTDLKVLLGNFMSASDIDPASYTTKK